MNLQKIKQQILADKQKFGVVMVLMAIGLLLWGRLMLKSVPRTAVADPKEEAALVTDAESLISASTDPVIPVVTIKDYGTVDRDLFAFDPVFFPSLQAREIAAESLEKSTPNQADEQLQRQQHVLVVRAEARSLKLQTTLLGTRNRAMINGELLEEGQMIQGFVLREVGSRKVTLVKDDVEVVLEM